MQLQIEREALKKEGDAASKERLKNVEKQLTDLHILRDAPENVFWLRQTMSGNGNNGE
jgi:hypothetical protein